MLAANVYELRRVGHMVQLDFEDRHFVDEFAGRDLDQNGHGSKDSAKAAKLARRVVWGMIAAVVQRSPPAIDRNYSGPISGVTTTVSCAAGRMLRLI
jgi:hypothetical protein